MGKGGVPTTPDLVIEYEIEDFEGDARDWDNEGAPDTSFEFGANVEPGDGDDLVDVAKDVDPTVWARERAIELNREAQKAGKLSTQDTPPEARPRPEPRTVNLGAQLPPERPARAPRSSERARARVEQASDELGAAVGRAGRQLGAAAGSLVEALSSVASVGGVVAGLARDAVRGLFGLFKR